MKLSSRQKDSVWDTFGHYKGRYKSFKVNISEASNEPFGGNLDYYYVIVDSDKYEVTYNSLWEGSKFKTIEEAEKYAIDYIDYFIKDKK